MDEKVIREVQRLLSKEALKDNLTKASLYVLAYETLKNSIIEKPKGFFTFGGIEADDDYKKEVLSKHRNPLIASCRWFQENGAISETDVNEFLTLREHRNYIAHELPNVLLNTSSQVDEDKEIGLFHLLCKIDRWWILEFEIPINSEFDGKTIDPTEVRSLGMEFLWYLTTVVYDLGDALKVIKQQGEAIM